MEVPFPFWYNTRNMRKPLTVLALLLAVDAFADRYPFERYQTIVDRQMFGPPPPGFDPTKMPSEVAKTSSREEAELSQEQEQVKRSVRFSVLNVTASGEPVVGFTDSADAKNPMHYYMKVGESQNGWTVKAADPEAATMTIEKDGVEVTLKLGGDSSSGPQGAPGAAQGRQGPRGGASSPLLAGAKMSLRERRRREEEQMREDAATRAEEEKARAAREEEEKSRREAEREEQRKQLMQIQEELRRAREAREAQKAAEPPAEGGEASDTAE